MTACDLPLDGVREQFNGFIVARTAPEADGGAVVGCAAIELYGTTCVFRSLAVATDHRGQGLGRRLMESALLLAAAHGCREAYLLTRTIERMASRQGFERVERDQVAAAAKASVEFSIDCCSTAVVMRLSLSRSRTT